MGTYGRNFGFRMVPDSDDRHGRWVTPATGTYVMGQGVEADDSAGIDTLGRQTLKAATPGSVPTPGRSGIAIYEHGDGATWAGQDPFLTTYSDLSTLPVSKAVQVISGVGVKVVFTNTDATTFLQTRSYAARNMVGEGGGATPNIAVGSFLEPNLSPSDSTGYWRQVNQRANAWLVVTSVDSTRQEVEAQFLF